MFHKKRTHRRRIEQKLPIRRYFYASAGASIGFIILFLVVKFVYLHPKFISPIPVLGAMTSVTQPKTTDTREGIQAAFDSKSMPITGASKNSDGSYIVKLKSGEEIILDSEKDLNEQISSLQYLLKRITMEGKRVSRLDLRFEKPVVVFSK